MGFETFAPVRKGRVPEQGSWARLTRVSVKGKPIGQNLRLTRGAVKLIGLDPKRGDHFYFVVEVDLESGALRLTPTDNVALGRLLNPTNLQMTLPKTFREWTGWGESRWEIEEENGSLLGRTREIIYIETS